eukprot:gene11478-12675_t
MKDDSDSAREECQVLEQEINERENDEEGQVGLTDLVDSENEGKDFILRPPVTNNIDKEKRIDDAKQEEKKEDNTCGKISGIKENDKRCWKMVTSYGRGEGIYIQQKKTSYMVIRAGKEKLEEANIMVKNGKIERADKYKYLGNRIREDGKVTTQIEEKEKEASRLIISL